MARDNMELFSSILKPLLLAIVSFLPSQEATTRTPILLQKWSKIWQSEENIDFNENFFVDSTSDENKQEQRKVFINFITSWIAHFPSRAINRFSLTVSNPQTCGETVGSCVAFATQRGVKELILDFSDPKWEDNNFDGKHALFQLPTHVYQLGLSLESLKLYSCGFDAQDFLNFGALKDLSLGWIEVKIKTLKKLLSTCRTIESLNLVKCWNLANFDLGDEPLGLTRLVVNKCDSEYFIFNAPNLKYFKYSGVVFTSDINVRAIEEVDIDFSQESEFNERGNELCQILHDFSAAKILIVCSYLLQVVPSGDEPVKMQSALNVKHLTLKTKMHSYELCGFEFMLNSCPLLEKLTLDISPQLIFEDYTLPYQVDLKKFWQTRRVFPECLKNSLKVVEVIGLRATNEELMTCCFLMQGKVLEQINIKLWNEDDGKEEFRRGSAQLLVKAQKGSKNLQISID